MRRLLSQSAVHQPSPSLLPLLRSQLASEQLRFAGLTFLFGFAATLVAMRGFAVPVGPAAAAAAAAAESAAQQDILEASGEEPSAENEAACRAAVAGAGKFLDMSLQADKAANGWVLNGTKDGVEVLTLS
jgi:hypothetical protein